MEFDENNSGDIGEYVLWIHKAFYCKFLMLCNYYSSMLSGCVVADMMELKRMMEKLGQPKTHLELKKMIAEVDTNNSGTAIILYNIPFYS